MCNLTKCEYLTGPAKAGFEELARTVRRCDVAARILRAVRARHVNRKMAQASIGVRRLLASLGAEALGSAGSLRTGDVIVISGATNGRRRSQWNVHGSIVHIGPSDPSADVKDPCVSVTSLDISSYVELGDLPEGTIVHASRPGVVDGATKIVGHLEFRNRRFHLDKLDEKCRAGQVFRLPPSVPFDVLQKAYVLNAAHNGMRPYSRQNNCNHAVFNTLRIVTRAVMREACLCRVADVRADLSDRTIDRPGATGPDCPAASVDAAVAA